MSLYIEVVFNLPVRKSFCYLLPEDESVERNIVGCRVIAPLGKRKLTGFVIGTGTEAPAINHDIRLIQRVVDSDPLFGGELLELSNWLSATYMCSQGEALAAILPGGRRESDSDDWSMEGGIPSKTLILAERQRGAVETILEKGSGLYYLQGVTGSGKTEVYLQVARQILKEGKDVIYLVPEISLVPQTVNAVISGTDRRVAVLHSGMTPSQRLKEWHAVRKGEAKFIVGARSAVFAPVGNLGLIILDEEQEGTYKSSSNPRYHARQVAAHRCRQANAILLMGSATPSTDAYLRMEQGELTRLTLTERLSGGKMPDVEVVDMKKEKGVLSGRLIDNIKAVHREGRQIILFLNRRGFSYLFFCRSCGYELKCERCSVSLTYHKSLNSMICHYCGYRVHPPEVCPECASLDIGQFGFGTERIQEELATIFPDLNIRRVDTDSIKKKIELKQIMDKFRSGELDLLLGTQMVAKGLDFPGVKLVGIVNADVGLQLPDFRSFERCYSLIVQVAGRAGRTIPDGKVIVQTFQPENSVLGHAVRNETEEFYSEELENRNILRFPPFYRMIRIVFRGKNRKQVSYSAVQFKARMETSKNSEIEILGPVVCPFPLIAGNYRIHLIFRGESFPVVHRRVAAAVSRFSPPRGVYLEIDVDPVSLL